MYVLESKRKAATGLEHISLTLIAAKAEKMKTTNTHTIHVTFKRPETFGVQHLRGNQEIMAEEESRTSCMEIFHYENILLLYLDSGGDKDLMNK